MHAATDGNNNSSLHALARMHATKVQPAPKLTGRGIGEDADEIG